MSPRARSQTTSTRNHAELQMMRSIFAVSFVILRVLYWPCVTYTMLYDMRVAASLSDLRGFHVQAERLAIEDVFVSRMISRLPARSLRVFCPCLGLHVSFLSPTSVSATLSPCRLGICSSAQSRSPFCSSIGVLRCVPRFGWWEHGGLAGWRRLPLIMMRPQS